MNDKTKESCGFEDLFTETLTIIRRGISRKYTVTEITEEQMQKLLEGDTKTFGARLVVATVTDDSGDQMTMERFLKLPGGIATKLRMKALEVNGEGQEAADNVGES